MTRVLMGCGPLKNRVAYRGFAENWLTSVEPVIHKAQQSSDPSLSLSSSSSSNAPTWTSTCRSWPTRRGRPQGPRRRPPPRPPASRDRKGHSKQKWILVVKYLIDHPCTTPPLLPGIKVKLISGANGSRRNLKWKKFLPPLS